MNELAKQMFVDDTISNIEELFDRLVHEYAKPAHFAIIRTADELIIGQLETLE